MTFEEFLERANHDYESVIHERFENHPLSISKIEEKRRSEVYNTVYLQDFLRYRTLTMISVYHDYLREQLIKTMNVDIGDFLGLEQLLRTRKTRNVHFRCCCSKLSHPFQY